MDSAQLTQVRALLVSALCRYAERQIMTSVRQETAARRARGLGRSHPPYRPRGYHGGPGPDDWGP